MAFKIYFNKKTGHPSISLSGKDKTKWENLEMTHGKSKNDSYIDIVCVSNKGKNLIQKFENIFEEINMVSKEDILRKLDCLMILK